MLDLTKIDNQIFTGFDNQGNALDFKAEIGRDTITLFQEDEDDIEIVIEINKDGYSVYMTDMDVDDIILEFECDGELLKSEITNILSKCIKHFLNK